MLKKKILLILCMILLVLPIISADKIDVQTSTIGTETINIFYPQYPYMAQNNNMSLNIHVTNSTNIMTNITTSCFVDVYDNTGDHLAHQYLNYDNTDTDFKTNLLQNNFSNLGIHAWTLQCNSSEEVGTVSGVFIVNPYGLELTDAKQKMFNSSLIILSLFFILAIVGIFYIDNYIGKFTCYWISHLIFVLITFSVWQFTHGYSFGYVGFSGIFKVLFWVSTIAVFPMVLLSLAWIFYIHTMNDMIKGFMEKGMDESEAIKRARSRKRKW